MNKCDFCVYGPKVDGALCNAKGSRYCFDAVERYTKVMISKNESGRRINKNIRKNVNIKKK